MAQFLIRTSDGLVATVLPAAHVWGACECWPTFVILDVQGQDAAIAEAIDAARDADGLAHVAIDSLSNQVVNALASSDRATVALPQLTFSGAVESTKLAAATVSRADERAAFGAWHVRLGDLGDTPADANKQAAEASARANLAAKRGGQGVGSVQPGRVRRQ